MNLSPSSLIFVAIIAGWVAYLVPQWIRRREQLQASRTHDRHSRGTRVLEPRAARSHPDGASSAPIHRRRKARDVAADDVENHPDGTDLPNGTTTAHRARAEAARRRLLVLITLVVVTVLSAVAAAFPAVPTWVVLPGAGLLVLDVAAIVLTAPARNRRRSAARAAARSAARSTARSAVTSRLAVPDPGPAVLKTASVLVAEPVAESARTTSRSSRDRDGGVSARARRDFTVSFVDRLSASAHVSPQPAAAAGTGGMAGTGTDTWTPVPVPRPTYTLKPTAPRPMPRPLAAPEASVRLVGSESTQEPGLRSPSATPAPAAHVPVVESAPPKLDLDAVLARRRAANA